ncbi:MAG: triose-phosphate isomerase [Chloroflexi bacterium]|nr:triose-phosphate isomerase [Chloroflexota bacterium]
MRRPILAGNWKMNKTVSEAVALVSAAKADLLAISGVEKVFCPSFMAIPDVARLVSGTELGVGAQDMYWEASGAFTGEVSPLMVQEYCQYVIIGHSERREFFHETDETVNRKLHAALAHGLTPIVCVGETIALRQAGKTESWVAGQVEAALQGLTAEQVASMVIAYEPIWAIGTGLAATAEEAERVCRDVVRATVARLYGEPTAEALRIQYGGSVKPDNTAELMAQPNIDGGLVGGASLKAADFVAIVRLTAEAKGLI